MKTRKAAFGAAVAATTLSLIAVSVLGAGGEPAATRAAVHVGAGSVLWMDGKSTVHDWSSRTTAVQVEFTRAAGEPDPASSDAIDALVRNRGFLGLEVKIPVTTLHSEKQGLDKNMMKSLRPEQHPHIEYRMGQYVVVSPADADTVRLRVEGTLRVTGVEKPVTLDVRAWKSPEGEWIEGSQALDMSAFGIKPPTMMLGTLKVADRIVIHYRLLLTPGAGASRSQAATER